MNSLEEIKTLIGQPEGVKLEYKAVLPPSKSMAKLLSSFANTEGGTLILGISDLNGGIEVNGISEDFHAKSISNKAIDMLNPSPKIEKGYIDYEGKRLFVLQVEKSSTTVLVEGKTFIRDGERTVLVKEPEKDFKDSGYGKILSLSNLISEKGTEATSAKSKFLDHYQSVIKIIDDLGNILYPVSPNQATSNPEGKILIRILFSSCADNFESYLSDLLNEIYLALPNTLKSGEQVSIKEVLDCADIEDFVSYWASKKISKLQRGSVKGFLKGSKQIDELGVIDNHTQDELERILQIRHLYSHRNGIVDDKFLKYYPNQFSLNDEHKMSIDEVIIKLEYLVSVVDKIDQAAIQKYKLATLG